MKFTLYVVFNIVTGVGGHFINRRWDKAFLLFAAFILSLSLTSFYAFSLFRNSISSASISNLYQIYIGILLGFSFISTGLFILEYRKSQKTNNSNWTKSKTFAAIVFCLFSTLLLASYSYYYFFTYKVFNSQYEVTSNSKGGKSTFKQFSMGDHFNEYIYLSRGSGDLTRPLPEPPSGNAILFGKILQDGSPVEGIKLDVVLNDQYKVESLVSDDEGEFSFSVAAGIWKINAIFVHEWKNKPDGEFVVVTGRENTVSDSQYHKSRYDAGAVEINAGSGGASEIISLEINSAITITSPKIGVEAITENADELSIEWESHDKAAFYLLGIARVTKQGNTTSYHPINQTKTTETSISLADFTVIEDPDSSNDYSIMVTAFDSSGHFVSESVGFRRATFQLNNHKIAEQSIVNELRLDFSNENYDEFYDNNRRISAVEVLLDNNMISEAENLVSLITKNSRAGKIDALKGYILAKQGNCADAEIHFRKALKEGGASCLPQKYRSACL